MNNFSSGIRQLFSVILPHKKTMIITILCATIASLSNVFATLTLGDAIDQMVGKGDVNFPNLFRSLLLLAILYTVASITTWFVSILSNRIAYRTARDLRISIGDKLGRLPLSYFDTHPHGDIISRFTNDLDSVSDALSLGLVSLFMGIVTILSALIIMLYLSIPITLVILLMTPLCFLAAWILTKTSQKTFQKQQKIVGDLSGFISETVGNMKTIKAFGYEEKSVDKFETINADLNVTGRQAQFAAALLNPATRVIDNLSYTLVGIVGGLTVIASGINSVGTIASFLIFSSQFSKPINEISGIMANIQTASAAMMRVQSILNEKEQLPDQPDATLLEHPKGDIVFNNIDFAYRKNQKLIQNLSLEAKPGKLVAIVGPTGAGKTTIVNLLMRFYEINQGVISIDGKNIIDITRDSLRRAFGMVLQETWLFHGTVRENIAYGKEDASEDEIIAASKFAHAHSFIMRMEHGYDTMIAEDGGNLSVGQKQLLTIARVMLTNPSLLILDEATSSIDTLTEQRVQRAFFKMMYGRTSFVIAHRLSTIISADLILVLDKGQVIETGTHQQLLEQKGFYYQLYHSQFE